MLVVTMTSWTKRINNVKPVVESVMRNTMKPDRVYLNLSSTEFNGIELPNDLVNYFNSDDRLILNWVGGENTKTMKKVFPILQYLNDDDIIINIDDDTLLPENFIEHRYKEFLEKKTGITSCNNPKFHYVNRNLRLWSCGQGSIFSKKMLNGWDRFMNKTLIHSYNDDYCYSAILWLNGYMFEPCSSFFMQGGAIDKNGTKLKKFNAVEPLGKGHGYVDRDKMYNLLNQRVIEMFGVGFEKSFGMLKNNKKTEKHDCVMVYGKSGVDSQEMTCGEHLEIEYVIASLKRYCKSWLGRIFVVGSEPPISIKNDVIHIPCDNPYTHCKDANIIHKLRYACENIPDLSDDFLMISDDQIVTKESSWDDMRPRILLKFKDLSEMGWNRKRKIDFWHECLYNTLKLFPKETAAFWEPHIWSPMNKYKFVDMCRKYDYQNNTNCISQSLYYNYVNQEQVFSYDHEHMNGKHNKENLIKPENAPRHISWTDEAFSSKRFRDFLDYIVGFKDTFEDNKQYNMNMVMQLRRDIRLGNVVQVHTGDGKFKWKKISK